MRRSLRVNRRRGFSLVEIAMVLSIISLLVAGLMQFYSNVVSQNMGKDSKLEFVQIQSTIHGLYEGQPDYTGLTDVIVTGSPEIPSKWKNAGKTQLMTPWHSPLSILTLDNPPDALFIVYHNVPPDICMQIVTSDPGPSSGWTVGGAVPVYSAGWGQSMPPSMANVACGYPVGSQADLALSAP